MEDGERVGKGEGVTEITLKRRPMHERLGLFGMGDVWEIIRAQQAMIDHYFRLHLVGKKEIDEAASLVGITGERMAELIDKGTEAVDETA